jgi:hypothetical protein
VSAADAPPDEEEDSSRRRALALFGAALLALLGAGAGVSNRVTSGDDESTAPSLSVSYDVTSDPPAPTPPGADAGSDGGAGQSDRSAPAPAADGAPSGTDPTSPDDGGRDGEGIRDTDDGSRPNGGTVAPASVRPADPVSAAVPPVVLSDVSPGDGGDVALSLSLSGSPARLLVRGTASDFDEGGVVEAEREVGDDGPPGELQSHVRVRLWYEPGGGDEDRVVYHGPLGGLGAVSEWTPLTDGCVAPGTHTVHLRWDLPADAPNDVQTDAVTFSLGVAADASDCR